MRACRYSGGAGTDLNAKTRWTFSAAAGMTCTFENDDADGAGGIDRRLDPGMSWFLHERLFVGAVGYACLQLTLGQGRPKAHGVDRRMGLRGRAARPGSS